MTPSEEEAIWRSRFITLNLVRIGGTVLVLIALIVWYGDVIVEGGTIALGLPLALTGLVISFWGPRYLARKWKADPPR